MLLFAYFIALYYNYVGNSNTNEIFLCEYKSMLIDVFTLNEMKLLPYIGSVLT